VLSRPRTLIAALGLATALLIALAGSGQARNAPRGRKAPVQQAVAGPLAGINLSGLSGGSAPEQASREIAEALNLHVKLVRVELPWAALQPAGPGPLNGGALAYADQLIGAAAAHHLGVIALVDVTPCWASSAPADLLAACRADGSSAANSWPPAQPSDYGAVVGQLAARYGTKLTAIEVWNEPDEANEKYFAGPDKPQRYAEVLRAGYTAIKQANPGIKVLAGSLVGSDGTFLRRLYAAGIKGYYDGLSVHFYTLTLASLREFREAQLASGDRSPLWLDEFGWPTCYPGKAIEEEIPCVTPAVQAQNVTNLFRSLSRTSYVATDTLYKLRDSPNSAAGVLTQNGARKPAYGALASVLLSPQRSPAQVTLALRRAGRAIVASGSGPFGDYMRLEASRGALRYRAKFTLDRFNRYRLSLPAALGTHGVHVRVFQEWLGAASAAQGSI
jgi:polysaccharide biosynthesis protein PslG